MGHKEPSEDDTTEDMINQLAMKGKDLTDDDVGILCDWVLAEKNKLEKSYWLASYASIRISYSPLFCFPKSKIGPLFEPHRKHIACDFAYSPLKDYEIALTPTHSPTPAANAVRPSARSDRINYQSLMKLPMSYMYLIE